MKHYEAISNYNDMLYDSRPVTINEYLSDKYNNVHKELFNDALNKYINQYVSKFINDEFIFHLFTVLNTNENYNNIKNIEYIDSLLYNNIVKLEINSKKFIVDIIHIIDNNIEELIEYMLNNNIIYVYTIENDQEENININYDIVLNTKLTRLYIDDFRKYKNINNIKYVTISFNDNCDIKVSINSEKARYINNDIATNIDQLSKKISKNIKIDIYNKAIEYFKKSHRIIEIKNTEYWMPSEVIIIHNGKPFTKNKVDLTKYWNNHQKLEDYDISKLKMTNENILDSEVTYLDYIKGTAKMFSKTNDMSYEIPFKYLNENSNVSEDMKLTNTFSHYV